ncbi:MAG TPA: flagellar biosynthesis protein FlhF, partial [Methylophaga sp.]|nr:flagellar biosynthesis protein FlhF [Methylophaga sp.]
IASLRDMLQNQLSDLTWKDMARQSPTQMQVLQRHMRMGTEVELAKQLVTTSQGIDDL